MPKISDDIIRAVTDAARIEDVVSDFVTLRRAGVNLTGLCPFHDDKHDGNFIVRPSTVSEKRGGNTYRCFVCDAKGGPLQFLMQAQRMTFPDAVRWLGRKYCIEVDNVPLNWTPQPPRPVPPPPPPLELPRAWVKRTMDIATWGQVTFRNWYMSLPWTPAELATAHDVLWQYCVGGWKDGRVVFWMIDADGVPRAAKLMRYHDDGHRDKTEHPGWIYNQDGCRQQCKPEEHTILKPLFGSHLLRRYPQAKVNVVESEKTALVLANYYGNLDKQLWLACGGLKHLQIESMQPLIDQGRKVWLWPDKDGVKEWQEVADKLGSDKVSVYSRFFDTHWTNGEGQKADAADITIRIMSDPTFRPNDIEADGQGVTDPKATAVSDHSTNPDPMPHTQQPTANSDSQDDEWFKHLNIMKAIGEYKAVSPGDEPFLDHEEHSDPRVHEWRMKCAVCSPGFGKT